MSNNGHSPEAEVSPLTPLELTEGQVRVDCPVTSNVIEVRASAGDAVLAGDTLMVVTAMKMETSITAPTSGTVVAVQELVPDDVVPAGSMLAVIAPSAESGQGPECGQIRQRQAAGRGFRPDSLSQGMLRTFLQGSGKSHQGFTCTGFA